MEFSSWAKNIGGYLMSADTGGSIIQLDAEMVKGLVILWINVIILIVILYLVLYKPVKAFLDKRSQKIQDSVENAKAKNESADELKKDYEQRMIEIEKEREEVLSKAYKKAMERSEHIIKEAQEEAENIFNLAIAEIEEERAGMEAELKKQLVELSVLIAGRFINDIMDDSIQEKYINEALSDWEEGVWMS